MRMALTLEAVLGIIGTVAGVTSFIVSVYFNKKAIEQTDRNLKTQLRYEDKKRALVALQRVINEADFWKLREKIKIFLDVPDSNFIPQEVISGVYGDIEKVEKFDEKNTPYPKQEEPPEPDDNYYDPTEGMNEYEKHDYALKKEIDSFKSSVKCRIDDALKKI